MTDGVETVQGPRERAMEFALKMREKYAEKCIEYGVDNWHIVATDEEKAEWAEISEAVQAEWTKVTQNIQIAYVFELDRYVLTKTDDPSYEPRRFYFFFNATEYSRVNFGTKLSDIKFVNCDPDKGC